MKQKPILDRFEIKGIRNISTFEHRSLAEHRVPGLAGSIFQDMGSEPVRIAIQGSLSYDESRQDVLNLEELRKAFIDGKAVPFVADITKATKITEVLITEVEIGESERWPGYFDYRIDLAEHTPEPASADVQEGVEEEAEERHESAVQQMKDKKGRIEVEVLLDEEVEADYSSIEVLVLGTTEDGDEFSATIKDQDKGIYVLENIPQGTYSAKAIRSE